MGYDPSMLDGVVAYPAKNRGGLIGPGNWDGLVHSLYANIINLLREDGLIVSLLADAEAMTAMGVLVPSLFVDQLSDSVAGRTVQCREGVITIDGVATIDLSWGQSWDGALDGSAARGIPAPRIPRMHEALVAHGKTGGLLGVLDGKPGNPFVDMARSALSSGRHDALVGLGPGLTPSGDDFLTGALAASRAAVSRERIEAALPGTSPFGRTMIWMALRGSFPAHLRTFTEKMARAESVREIENSVRTACSHGETSGTDALTGFCWALERKQTA
jgi:Protein of unknown function (DUF2877)